jgi:hypothetical protein
VRRFRKGAVVADRDEGAGEAAQPILQPLDRGDVEVVGRLVEQQHVRLLRDARGRLRRGAARRPTRWRRAESRSMPSWVATASTTCSGGASGRRGRVAQRLEAAHRRVLLEQHHLGARAGSWAAALVGGRWCRRGNSERLLAAPLRADSAIRSRDPTKMSIAAKPASQEPCRRPRFSNGVVRCGIALQALGDSAKRFEGSEVHKVRSFRREMRPLAGWRWR